jgi:hypothetical protein
VVKKVWAVAVVGLLVWLAGIGLIALFGRSTLNVHSASFAWVYLATFAWVVGVPIALSLRVRALHLRQGQSDSLRS